MTSAIRTIHRRLLQTGMLRLRRLSDTPLVSYIRPTAVLILVTERCSARCVHCDIWKNRGREDSPTLAEWQKTIKDIRSWLGPIKVVLTGGEALMRPYTIQLAECARSAGLYTEVLTHGYWADQRKIEQLAMADPDLITISLDGIGATHGKIRGIPDFFDRTNTSIETLVRMRTAHRLKFRIRLKTVIMEHNLHELGKIAEFATRDGMEVFYQPIEQNYNTPADPQWYETSDNWPRDPDAAVRAVEELIRLKRKGLHIANRYAALEVMLPYFKHPDTLQAAVRAHTATERKQFCTALDMLQIQSNGDVTVCTSKPPIGNIRSQSIRTIWAQRSPWWHSGCCREEKPDENGTEARLVQLTPGDPAISRPVR